MSVNWFHLSLISRMNNNIPQPFPIFVTSRKNNLIQNRKTLKTAHVRNRKNNLSQSMWNHQKPPDWPTVRPSALVQDTDALKSRCGPEKINILQQKLLLNYSCWMYENEMACNQAPHIWFNLNDHTFGTDLIISAFR